jgi:ribose transport system substrate-binding protein
MVRGFHVVLICALAVAVPGCAKQKPTAQAPPAKPGPGAHKRYTIAVIPKGTTHVFWKSVEAGAKQAGEDLGVDIIWKGPLKENDRAQQIQLVQQFISQGVDGIVLAPLDYKALVGPVHAAGDARIPVVIIDSALEGQPGRDFVSFVATNNSQGGRLGGQQLAKLLGGKGKVVLLRYLVGSASTDDREKGFLEAIGESKGIRVLVDNRYAGATAGEAKTNALNLIDQIRQADGVFCPNESSTMGMLLALQQEGLAGKIRFVGFDASPPLVKALADGEIDALVVQDPRKMGYTGVETLIAHLEGKQVEDVIDTGVVVVTRENMNDPNVKRLIE